MKFIEIRTNDFINLSLCKNIREINEDDYSKNINGILIDDKFYQYDTKHDRDEMFNRIKKLLKIKE